MKHVTFTRDVVVNFPPDGPRRCIGGETHELPDALADSMVVQGYAYHATAEEIPAAELDLENMSAKELKAAAKAAGHKGYSKLTVDELIELLEA